MAGPLQRNIGDVPRDGWDVVVAGAGPAGATAALHLARRGRRVLLADRHPFPREKVCGDGLIPDALRALERAGLLPRGPPRGPRGRRASRSTARGGSRSRSTASS